MPRDEQRKAFFQQITTPLIEGVVIIDRKGIIQAINKAVTDLFGYTEEALLGVNVKKLMPEKYSVKHDSYIDNYNRTGEAKILDVGRNVEGLKKDGTTFALNLKVSRVDYGDETYYMGVVHSLEEQIISAARIKSQEDLLEKAEKIAGLGHWRVDLVESTLFWSKEIYNIHGVDFETYQPELEGAIDFYHPDDVQIVRDCLEQAIQKQEDFTFEARVMRPSGEMRYVRSSGECTIDHDGNVTSVFGVFQDVTEQEEVLQALARANKELEEFAYRTSHDLRSPLVSSLGLVDIAKSALTEEDITTAKASLEHIGNSLGKLEVLVKDILALTEAKNREEENTEVNIEELIESALEKFAHMEDFDQLLIETSCMYQGTTFLKESRVRLIIENLISNAIKYQDRDEAQSYIHIKTYEKNGNFVLKLEDNGLGVPVEQRDKLFQMFKRFHNHVSFGSGLGLYMVKKSAEILGGDILFEQPDKGVIFKLVIPVEKLEA